MAPSLCCSVNSLLVYSILSCTVRREEQLKAINRERGLSGKIFTPRLSLFVSPQTHGREVEAKYFPRQTEQTGLLRYLVNSFFLGD